jgi:hypothetical protein
MKRTYWWTAVLAALTLPAATSCGDAKLTDPTPVPGMLIVALDGGTAQAGAVLLILRGDGIKAPTSLDPARQMFVQALDAGATTYRIAVVGERVAGGLFSFAVPDVNRRDTYSVTLLAVADEGNQLRSDVAPFRLSVLKEQ